VVEAAQAVLAAVVTQIMAKQTKMEMHAPYTLLSRDIAAVLMMKTSKVKRCAVLVAAVLVARTLADHLIAVEIRIMTFRENSAGT
jgi:hypothetical protein